MTRHHRQSRFWGLFIIGFLLVVWMAACRDVRVPTMNPTLPAVEAIPNPVLPDWIEQISPTGEADPLAQIRIRFQDPLIPLESLEESSQNEVLRHFELTPSLPGQFRFLTPRMVGFEAEQALPKATRVRVTLKAGLTDLADHRLDTDVAWTFNTEPIRISNLPGVLEEWEDERDPINLTPTLELISNVELDLRSLREHLQLIPNGRDQSVALSVNFKDNQESESHPSLTPQEQFDPSQRNWIYTFSPRRSLQKATPYQIVVTPDLKPANGNMPTDMAFTSEVMTYAPLAFEGIEYVNQPDGGGAYGRFVKGSAQLNFNNAIEAESALEAITVSPPPKEAPRLVQASDGNRAIALNPWSLEPDTTYTITIDAGLTDVFGQPLEEPVTVEYDTGDVAADLWAPSDLNIFPASKDLQLNISAVNLPDGAYKAAFHPVQPSELVYRNSAYPRGEGNDLIPPPNTWQSYPIPDVPNETLDIAIPLRERLGGITGLLAYGIQARTNPFTVNDTQEWREPSYYGMVQLTNLGVVAQWFPQSGFVRVNHLSDGAAVPGARVEVYRASVYGDPEPSVTGRPCAIGTTDPTGIWTPGLADLQGCAENSQGFSEPPQLLTVVREGADWAFVHTLEYSGQYGYGVYAGWEGDRPTPRGTVFSDRSLYQPGESAWFTAAAFYLTNGSLQPDPNTTYQVAIDDPNGQAIDLGTQTTNDYSTFSLKWEIPDDQPLGNYRIRATRPNGIELSGEFRIAEFKPPNFQVDLTLDQSIALIDDTIDIAATSQYLFGAPVQGGNATYYVTRQPTTFTPEGWDSFTFGRQWFWPEERPTVPSDVLQVSDALDEQGTGSQRFTIAQDIPYPMTYRVDVEVTDVSNLSVADTQTLTALPGDRLIGLQGDFVADAGEAFPVEVIVTDPEGTPIEGQRVRLELQQMIYSSVTQVIEGSPTARDQVEYKTVDTQEMRSASQPQTVSLTPSESGSYRIRANFTNSQSDQTATDLQLWATGPTPAYWGGRYDNNRLELKLDKERYQPGETATVLIQSPYAEADLYLAVVRHNTLYKTLTRVEGGAPQVQFQVTPDMVPNAAVEAILVRRGTPVDQVEPGTLDTLSRIGFVPFNTNLGDQYLSVELQTESAELRPGAEQTVNLILQDNTGQPAQGQFTVMVVNESVLQLTGYRPPDLVETVYAEQPISTRFEDNRPEVVLQNLSSPLEKGWGYGGGFSAGSSSTRIRTDFRAIAYYNGAVETDPDGRAQVTFTLPDDLTTWRVMVIATDGNLHFGQADTTFITTQPLITNPVLPQFARPGDRFEAGLSVTNTTGETGQMTLTGNLQGALRFREGDTGQATQSLQTDAPTTTAAYRFDIEAPEAGDATVQFTTDLNRDSDGFAVPLTVKPLEVTEQVVETGTTDSQAVIPLNISDDVVPNAGGLELNLASTLITEIQAPAEQVLREEQLPLLEPAASQLAIAANLQILSQRYGQPIGDVDLAQHATQALERLQKLQQSDGGFAFWPGQETSDPLVSPYAAQAIARARAAGIDVDMEMVNALKSYLGTILADPGQYDYCQTPACKNPVRIEALLAGLALGDRRSDFLGELYAQRDTLDLAMQIKLARYLFQFPEWTAEATEMANQIQEIIYQTGRSATVNLPQPWRWLSSQTTAQAQALRLFTAIQSPLDVLDRILVGLLDLRRDGTWATPYDNAEALMALVDYSRLTPEPPSFTAQATLADNVLASPQFQGYQPPSITVQVPMSDLPTGHNDLTLQKSGNGTLHYLAAYRYRPEGNLPGRFNGIRVTRKIHRANEQEVLHQMGLQPTHEITMESGQVFDIGLEIITDHPINHLVITDPLPAGLEAVDTSFQSSTSYFQPQIDSWAIRYQTIHSDRIEAYGDRLEAGVYSLHYLVRSVTPGTYLWPGADAHLQYTPEEFGRSASTTLNIE